MKVTSAPAIVTLEVTFSQNGDAVATPIVVGPWKLRRGTTTFRIVAIGLGTEFFWWVLEGLMKGKIWGRVEVQIKGIHLHEGEVELGHEILRKVLKPVQSREG